MNIVKSMEAIVIGALAMTFVAAVATASAPAPRKATPVAVSADSMTTIVVTGKRLTPGQKAALAD